MKIEKYLIISMTETRYGWGKATVVLKEKEAKLKGNEISLKLLLDIPEAVFRRPKLEARMSIPEQVIPKNLITPEIQSNIEKVVKQAVGLDISVALVEHPTWRLEEQHGRDIHANPFFEAICPHGIGHHKGVHGCDGCCETAPKEIWDKVTKE